MLNLVVLSAGLLLVAIATVCLASLYLIIKRRRFSHLPGPPLPSFWLGHLPTVRDVIASGRSVNDYWYDCHAEYGPVWVFWLLHFETVHVADAVEGRRLLQDPDLAVKHFTRHSAMRLVAVSLGMGW